MSGKSIIPRYDFHPERREPCASTLRSRLNAASAINAPEFFLVSIVARSLCSRRRC